jgi:hypothetical protein
VERIEAVWHQLQDVLQPPSTSRQRIIASNKGHVINEDELALLIESARHLTA